jgi:hypothetical protein
VVAPGYDNAELVLLERVRLYRPHIRDLSTTLLHDQSPRSRILKEERGFYRVMLNLLLSNPSVARIDRDEIEGYSEASLHLQLI